MLRLLLHVTMDIELGKRLATIKASDLVVNIKANINTMGNGKLSWYFTRCSEVRVSCLINEWFLLDSDVVTCCNVFGKDLVYRYLTPKLPVGVNLDIVGDFDVKTWCADCNNCYGCRSCYLCSNCVACRNCNACMNCVACRDCESCDSCQKCTKSSYSKYCENCYKVIGCHNFENSAFFENLRREDRFPYRDGNAMLEHKNGMVSYYEIPSYLVTTYTSLTSNEDVFSKVKYVQGNKIFLWNKRTKKLIV